MDRLERDSAIVSARFAALACSGPRGFSSDDVKGDVLARVASILTFLSPILLPPLGGFSSFRGEGDPA